ncbi:hypothetical protein SDC9_83361 [bioreactor metagenome]|uniref:Uncharacterized protein n=1 Tax=bioreactor metagenome TaxID=1076179 RepID=A0A644Z817_9ZZZZ
MNINQNYSMSDGSKTYREIKGYSQIKIRGNRLIIIKRSKLIISLIIKKVNVPINRGGEVKIASLIVVKIASKNRKLNNPRLYVMKPIYQSLFSLSTVII